MGSSIERLCGKIPSSRPGEAEHELYPHALALIAEHKVRWSGDDAVGNTNVTAAEVALFKQPEA